MARSFENRGRKVRKKWQLGAKKSLYFVMAAQASYICFTFYQALGIFSNNNNNNNNNNKNLIILPLLKKMARSR